MVSFWGVVVGSTPAASHLAHAVSHILVAYMAVCHHMLAGRHVVYCTWSASHVPHQDTATGSPTRPQSPAVFCSSYGGLSPHDCCSHVIFVSHVPCCYTLLTPCASPRRHCCLASPSSSQKHLRVWAMGHLSSLAPRSQNSGGYCGLFQYLISSLSVDRGIQARYS